TTGASAITRWSCTTKCTYHANGAAGPMVHRGQLRPMPHLLEVSRPADQSLRARPDALSCLMPSQTADVANTCATSRATGHQQGPALPGSPGLIRIKRINTQMRPRTMALLFVFLACFGGTAFAQQSGAIPFPEGYRNWYVDHSTVGLQGHTP